MGKNICKIKVEKLSAEYRTATEDLMKKQCYVQGLLDEMVRNIERFYGRFEGRWCRDYFIKELDCEYPSRIIKTEVESWMDTIHLVIYVGMNPSWVSVCANCTQKEKSLLREARDIWDKSLRCNSFIEAKKYIEIANELRPLKNDLEITNCLHFYIELEDIYENCTICRDDLLIQTQKKRNVTLRSFNIRNIIKEYV